MNLPRCLSSSCPPPRARWPLLAGVLLWGAAGCGRAPPSPVDVVEAVRGQPVSVPDPAALLADAVDRYEQSRLERLLIAVDPNERFETLHGPSDVEYLLGQGDYDTLFNLGDESFEFERDGDAGFGQGPPPPGPLPPRPARLHDGERGGLDAGSCRACHFSGGPDGAGTSTQVGLFRGDGEALSSAQVRDAPHVMGLGYLSALAAWLNLSLESQVIGHQLYAEATEEPVFAALEVDGINFGNAVFHPDGSIDAAGLTHLSPDFVVRPFGLKGRHATLVDLVDEALQVHHGHQSTSREETFADDTETYLGPGPAGDRDDDGRADEATDAQAVVLSSYLSMLPIPVIRAPERADLQAAWAEGGGLFEEVGCAECHRTDLRLQLESFPIEGAGESELYVPMNPFEVGEEPKPQRLDFGTLEPGTPLFAFTDLRRHEMGPALAEEEDEVLPGGVDTIPGDVWLTRPLWGLADTAPYLHDGRAPTVHDAISLHGGNANQSRLAYVALSDEEKAALRVFLMTLTREPTVLVE